MTTNSAPDGNGDDSNGDDSALPECRAGRG